MKTIKELNENMNNSNMDELALAIYKQALKDVLGLNKQFFQEQKDYFKKPETAMNKAIIELINAWEEELKARITG